MIAKVEATNVSNAPFRIFLENEKYDTKKEIILTMDAKTCVRYGIPMSLDIVGKKIVCYLESEINNDNEENKNAPSKKTKQKQSREIQDDELRIKSLKKKEEYYSYASLLKNDGSVKRKLELISFNEGDGMHFHIIPCPFYHLFLDLTDEEFKECKELTGEMIFRVNFKLKTA